MWNAVIVYVYIYATVQELCPGALCHLEISQTRLEVWQQWLLQQYDLILTARLLVCSIEQTLPVQTVASLFLTIIFECQYLLNSRNLEEFLLLFYSIICNVSAVFFSFFVCSYVQFSMISWYKT